MTGRKCALAVALAVSLVGARGNTDPGSGSPAPATTVMDRAGHAVPLTVTPVDVTIVDFFATWCEPCHLALAALEDLCREQGARVRIYVVDVGESPAAIDGWFASRPLPSNASVVLDRDGSASRAWGQHRFPTTFLVGRDGVIRHINRGYGPGYPARLRRWMTMMLAP